MSCSSLTHLSEHFVAHTGSAAGTQASFPHETLFLRDSAGLLLINVGVHDSFFHEDTLVIL